MAKPRGPVPPAFADLVAKRMPRHVAIIMDGNGRWAKAQGKLRALGHRAGMDRLVQIVRTSSDIGLDALTLYAFSTENWKRPRPEIEVLFGLLVEYIRREIDTLHKNRVRLRILGEWESLSPQVVSEIERSVAMTRENDGMTLCIALNYGGRAEIVRAARALADGVLSGEYEAAAIDQTLFEGALYTAGVVDPDLVIRTSGEQRLSNFLLYQAAYAEFMSVDAYWPDFTFEVYAACLKDYMNRERRFGSIGGSDL
jgi:undecaprenyl diphosphate synthase